MDQRESAVRPRRGGRRRPPFRGGHRELRVSRQIARAAAPARLRRARRAYARGDPRALDADADARRLVCPKAVTYFSHGITRKNTDAGSPFVLSVAQRRRNMNGAVRVHPTPCVRATLRANGISWMARLSCSVCFREFPWPMSFGGGRRRSVWTSS